MINEVNTQEWLDFEEAVQDLDSLNKFAYQWNSTDKRMEDIWKSFRLLPLQSSYLIASHYFYDRWIWSFKTGWELFAKFDKCLKDKKDLNKISTSITSAIEVQQKIVSLQRVFATVKDKTKTTQDKVRVFQDLKYINNKLYQDMIHKIGSPIDGFLNNDTILQPNVLYTAAIEKATKVVEKMLYLYKDGHPELEDCYFDKI